MLYDFIQANKSEKKPMYRQIYLSIRQAIESGSLKQGSKLPSIRKLSADKNISKTTVSAAYEQLCAEGYILNKPQSGYYVAAKFERQPKPGDTLSAPAPQNRFYRYDFSGKSIDESIVDLAEWKKCIKDVINRTYLLTSYGDSQGEEPLRLALQKYALGTRSANARADSIVVGAGTQAILYLLCSLLGYGKTVVMEEGSFVQSELIFKSFNYRIAYAETDANGMTVHSLKEYSPDVILINPNAAGIYGENMPVTRRLELIEWAQKNNALIFEDDYNGELRYSTLPMPCVQNYDTENTVYIGSFSKVLLPSVRLSYTVLPPQLLTRYNSVKRLMNQTASKTEQLALAQYINNGKIDVHLRKARRIYLQKSKRMLKSINACLPGAKTAFNETSLYLTVTPPFAVDREKVLALLAEKSVRLMISNSRAASFALSFSGIETQRIDEGVRLFCEALEQSRI